MKYIVGYSGGIDSTYVAWSLKKQGHDVLLINFINFQNKNELINKNLLEASAKKLDIKIEIIDLKKDFKKFILDDFAHNYINGLTPNPCIKCNETIKFAIFEKMRKIHKYDTICTGHYANLIDYKGKRYISKPVDSTKDQTYMIYRLALNNDKLLEKIQFPLANLIKKEIKSKIENYNIPIFSKKESQNICFLNDNDYPRFIKQNYHIKIKTGPIVDPNGKYLGEHKGLIYYTIGQRHGLNLGAISMRQYVLEIDYVNNKIIVGDEELLYKNKLKLKDNFLFSDIIAKTDFIKSKIIAKIRYRHNGGIIKNINNKSSIFLKKPVRAITPGQHCVIYKKLLNTDIIIGGGIIEKTLGYD